MQTRFLFFAISFAAINVSQSNGQSFLKNALPNVYAATRPPYNLQKTPIRNIGARKTTTIFPLVGETDAYYDTIISSYMGQDSLSYTYSNGRGYDAKNQTSLYAFLYDNCYYYYRSAYSSPMRYILKQSQTFDINNNVLTNLFQRFDSIASSWINSSININTYDVMNNLLTSLYQGWNASSGTWRDSFKYTYTYDANGNVLTDKEEVWDGASEPLGTSLYTYTYDSRNNMLSKESQFEDKKIWRNYTLNAFTYDSNNNKTSEIDKVWSTSSLSWLDSNQYTFTYNSTNKVLTELGQFWYIPLSSWFNWFQSKYTYNVSGDLETSSTQIWVTSSWQNSTQSLNKYNGTHDDTETINQQWAGATSTWNNINLTKSTYDANHDPLTYAFGNWNNATSSFVYSDRYIYTYNSNYQVLTETNEGWSPSGYWNPFDGDLQIRLYYGDDTGVNNTSNEGRIKVYPIPANDIMNVDLNWDTSQTAVAVICNMQGMLCRQWQIPASSSTHHSVPVAQLPAGNYILKITGEKGQLSQQISIVH